MEDSKRSKELDMYCALMNEVKKRTQAITDMLRGRTTTSFRSTNIEFMCLQIRKMLELISMGSLVLNKEEFEAIGKKYEDFWNAKQILQDIERLNPDFYPRKRRDRFVFSMGVCGERCGTKHLAV